MLPITDEKESLKTEKDIRLKENEEQKCRSGKGEFEIKMARRRSGGMNGRNKMDEQLQKSKKRK